MRGVDKSFHFFEQLSEQIEKHFIEIKEPFYVAYANPDTVKRHKVRFAQKFDAYLTIYRERVRSAPKERKAVLRFVYSELERLRNDLENI